MAHKPPSLLKMPFTVCPLPNSVPETLLVFSDYLFKERKEKKQRKEGNKGERQVGREKKGKGVIKGRKK